MFRALSVLGPLGALLAFTGCSSLTDTDTRATLVSDHLIVNQRGPVVFITQDAVEPHVMEALFEGVISTDDRGCLRLDMEGDEAPTAIWPHGFTLDESTAPTPGVLNADGVVIGTVGGTFEVGGGIVAELPESYGFTDADRELAAEQCPGSYWIVGEVPAG